MYIHLLASLLALRIFAYNLLFFSIFHVWRLRLLKIRCSSVNIFPPYHNTVLEIQPSKKTYSFLKSLLCMWPARWSLHSQSVHHKAWHAVSKNKCYWMSVQHIHISSTYYICQTLSKAWRIHKEKDMASSPQWVVQSDVEFNSFLLYTTLIQYSTKKAEQYCLRVIQSVVSTTSWISRKYWYSQRLSTMDFFLFFF